MAEERGVPSTEEQEMKEEKQNSESDEESEEEESDGEEYFEVEKIMSRKKRNNVFLYRVRWKGYPPSKDTWEPVENLEVVLDMVEEFDAKEEEKAKARQEERRLRKLRMEGKKLPGEESSDDSSNSEDDDRLLNEDTKFFKMLEKNKEMVLGQPDLYSKVKSRTAFLASKKKNSESHQESSVASSKQSQKQPDKDSGSRGRGRPRGGGSARGRGVGKGRGKPSKISPSDSSEEDSSPEPSSKRKSTGRAGKTTGKGAGRPSKKAISDSSEEDSDNSVPPPQKKSTGKGRGRPPKKTVSDSEEADSDQSAKRKKTKGSGKAPPKKKAVIQTESSEDEADSDDSAPLAKTSGKGKGTAPKKKPATIQSDDDSASDGSSTQKKSATTKSSGKKQTPKKSATVKATSKRRKQLETSSESEAGQPEPVAEKQSDASCKPDNSSEKLPSSEVSLAESSAEMQNKGDKPNNQGKDTAVASLLSVAKVDKPKSMADQDDNTPLFPVAPRVVIPVLEKFAQSVGVENEEGMKQRLAGEGLSPRSKEDSKETKAEVEKEATNSGSDSMEMEVPERKQSVKAGKKKGSSRKRKQDTAVEHTKAVTKGEASPAKTSVPQSPSPSAMDSQTTEDQTSPPSIAMETDVSVTPAEEDEDLALPVVPLPMKKSALEKKVPPLKITVPKLKIDHPKMKQESLKSPAHSPMFLADVDKLEKQKSKDAMKSTRPQSSKESIFSASNSSVLASAVTSSVRKDVSVKSVNVSSSSPHLSTTSRPDLGSSKLSTTPEGRYIKAEPVSVISRTVKAESATSRLEQLDSSKMPPKQEVQDSRKKYASSASSSRDYSSAGSSDVGRESVFSLFGSSSSSPGSLTAGRDSLLSTPSRDTSGLFSGSMASTSSLYSSARDCFTSGRGPSMSSVSSRDQSQFSTSSHLSSGSGTGRDIHLASGYIHLSSGSSRDSSFSSPSSRDLLYPRGGVPDPKYGSYIGSSRHGLNSAISGKENADRDRQLGLKTLSTVPKKGEGVLPLDTILNSSLFSGDGDKMKYRGLDADFETALQRIDLEYLEKLLLPPVTPMELSDEELRQAVMDGNCYLVERALACVKPYNLDLPDNKGNTLLMNAVLRGSDDIIVHLLSRGADAQVQVNGTTALMLAVEHTESSTVFMLLEMGAHVNTVDHNGESALFKAVRRGDKQILKLILDHGANFNATTRAGLSPLQLAKQCRLADVETTLIDHIQRVVRSFEEQVNHTVRGTAKLVSCIFPHHCMPLCESDTITIPFKFQPTPPTGPGMGCLLFIAHARFNQLDVKCRLYGQCAVKKVTLNGVLQPCLTEESNFVLMCHPLINGWNELVIHTVKDPTSKAKLIVCAYKAQLIYK